MATLSCSESRSMYSWWWNSHNIPKNSKWLQENLTDIDAKVESMIKLIEEDGDSFARKAEMYYKKRPELMKHVEEFYRAYRALAERYNHAIGELRHAHYALARAFPQLTKEPPSKPLVLGQDPHSQQVEPLKLNVCEPSTAANTLFEKDSVAIINNDPRIGCAEGGMTTMALNNNLDEDKGAGHISISVEGRNFDDHVILLSSENSYKNTTLVESELEGKIENEVERLKEAPPEMGAEIKNVLPDQLFSSKLSFMRSEVEVCGGRDSVSDLNRKWLEQDLSSAEEEVKLLTNDVLIGNLKLRNAEGKYNLLMISKQSLKNEADYLAKKIATKDQQLSEKQEELETLQKYLQAESLQRTQIECTLKTLTTLHAQSQEDQKALAIELKHVLQMLTQLETNKQGLDEAVQLARDENEVLCQTNLHAAACIEDLQKELISLSEVKSRLEKEVSCHMSKTESLQHEVSCLKEEIKELNKKHKALVEHVETTRLGLNCVASEVKSFRDKNPVLGQNNVQSNGEKEILLENIGSVEEQYESNIVAGTTFSNFNTELERSQMNTKSLQERCQHGQVGNTEFVSGKATLLSQLQVVTRSMHSLLEKNAISENSLSAARHELDVLREKSKGLETICGILKEERSYLLNERDSLSLKLKTVERKLESLQKRCMVLQEKYYCLEKEKEAMHNQVQELEGFLSVERKERARVQMDSDLRMADLEKQIQQLEEENRWQQEEYQGELEDSLKAQIEFYVLKKFVKYIEGTNNSLISECQKHVETSVLAEKLISALESESFEQQLETELLLDEIERLRLYIHEIFKALDDGPEGQIDTDETMVTHFLGIIEGMKHSLLKHEDEKQLCLVENSVISTLLDQLSSDLLAAELQKKHREKELLSMTNEIFNVKLEKDEVLELNKKLQSELSECQWHAVILEAEKDCLCIKHDDLLEAYKGMVERNSQLVQDNRNLLMRFSDLESEKRLYDHYLDEAILEHLISINQSSIFRSLVTEKTAEMKLMNQKMEKDHEISCGLKRDIGMLSQKLGLYKAESLLFRDTIRKLEGEIRGMRECNVEMKKDAQSGKDMLLHMEQKLSSTESRLDAAEKLNLQLCQTIDELKSDEQESLHLRATLEKNVCNLSEKNSILMAEVDVLHKAKGELETELSLLGKQLNEKTSREENALAEENAFLQMKQLKVYHNHEPEFSEAASDAGTCLPGMFEEEPLLSNQGIDLPLSKFEQLKHRRFLHRRKRQRQSRKNGNNLDSPKIQRIKSKSPVFREGMRMKDTALAQAPESKSIHFRLHDQMLDLSETAENARNNEQLQLKIVRRSYATSQKDTYYSRPENSEVNHLSTDSDIEKELSANKLLLTRITEPSGEMKSIDVLERLISDAKTMQTLLAAVDHLKIKLRTCENGKNSRNVDLERVQQNLQEIEEAILQLIDLNIYLVKNIDGCPYPSPLLVNDALHTRHVTELAREGSEEIHRMQLEIQKIQHILLKVEEQENKRTRNRTIIRRDFFYRGRNNKGKQKNSVCGCFKPSTSGSEWLAEADATTSHCIVN